MFDVSVGLVRGGGDAGSCRGAVVGQEEPEEKERADKLKGSTAEHS